MRSDLGLLAGGYFLGFAATQLPLGTWLDRHGPKKVILGFLLVAVAGCAGVLAGHQLLRRCWRRACCAASASAPA